MYFFPGDLAVAMTKKKCLTFLLLSNEQWGHMRHEGGVWPPSKSGSGCAPRWATLPLALSTQEGVVQVQVGGDELWEVPLLDDLQEHVSGSEKPLFVSNSLAVCHFSDLSSDRLGELSDQPPGHHTAIVLQACLVSDPLPHL